MSSSPRRFAPRFLLAAIAPVVMAGRACAQADSARPATLVETNAAGIEVRCLPPEALDALVKRETEFRGKALKSAGITADQGALRRMSASFCQKSRFVAQSA